MKDETLLSLFDYLKKAGGMELGREVYEAAVKKKIEKTLQTRDVSNKKYTGKVMLYPRWFLDEYFKGGDSFDDDLPF